MHSYASFAEVLKQHQDVEGPVPGVRHSSTRSSARSRRTTSLVLFSREVKRLSATAGAGDGFVPTEAVGSSIPEQPGMGEQVIPFSASGYGDDSVHGPVQALSAVRPKPLPVRRMAMRVAQTAASAVPDTSHLKHHPCAVADGSSGVALKGGTYRASLRATLDAHQALLARMEKTLQAIEATSRTKKLAAMMQQEEVATHTSTIHPSHPFRCAWSCVMAVIVLYYNLAVPLRIMARYDCGVEGYTPSQCLSQWDWSLVLDYTCDAALVVGVLLRARYFAYRKYEGDRGVVETDAGCIWGRFVASPMCPLLAVLIFPLDVLAPATGYLLCLRGSKVASILLLSGTVKEAQQWLDQERGVTISSEAVTVALLSVYATLVTVWMAVGWCILHYGGAQSGNWISAIYWTLTSITTTGYGDIAPQTTAQTVYNVCASIVGPVVFATIIAKFSSYVKK